MAHVLWRGTWATRIRIISGLVLMLYVTLHFLNIAAVLVTPDFADRVQQIRLSVTRTSTVAALMTAALALHMGLALAKLIRLRSFRMPAGDLLQIVFGLAIPPLLASHVVYTMGAHNALGVDTRLGWVTSLIWGTTEGWLQPLLLLITWVHGCIGLHMWLRMTRWWRTAMPVLLGIGVLVPTLALLGYVSIARVIDGLTSDPRGRALAHEFWNWPDADGFALLARVDSVVERVIWAVLAATLIVIIVRRLIAAIAKPVRITYSDGPTVRAPRGQTLLDTSRMAGIGHAALCGGRGRCTTCRVLIEAGVENLPPPSEAEARALTAVGAPEGTRLACQVRPTGPATVFRVFGADGKNGRAHARTGTEAQLAVLFLDMRGFTARTDGQLPYDVVFLLNRFFDHIVPPIEAAGGTVDKYMGDGLMAVFEAATPAQSAAAGLRAIQGIGHALASFNDTLRSEGSAPVAIGMGLHLGTVVLGEIGASGAAPRTLIGDTVNIASRLEGATKTHAVQALISTSVLEAAGAVTEPDQITALQLRGHDGTLEALAVADARTLRA